MEKSIKNAEDSFRRVEILRVKIVVMVCFIVGDDSLSLHLMSYFKLSRQRSIDEFFTNKSPTVMTVGLFLLINAVSI